MKLMDAENYNLSNPQGWLLSEKLDGVRAIWDGENFISKRGNEFNAPEWFKNNMPDNIILDGELWEGRGMFQQTVGKIRAGVNWENIKFMVFDQINNDLFIKRFDDVPGLPAHCLKVDQIECRNLVHLMQFEKDILNKKGEGVILRNPFSKYYHKRTHHIQKLKRFKSDEALVIGDNKVIFNDLEFKMNINREVKPGDTVTFKYFGLNDSGIPRHATFTEVRNYE